VKRKIIKINEELCDGCGNCIVGCSEGALQLIDNKAKLVKEDFCDGFGDCVGTCPTGALVVEERKAADFDEIATKEYLLTTQGIEAVWRMEEAQKKHESKQAFQNHLHLGCPGSRMRELRPTQKITPIQALANQPVLQSELTQWPVQIHLVPPTASFFQNKELVVMCTCGPLASADVHWRYLRGRSVVVGCPKLDDIRPYAQKIGEILKEKSIPKVIVARMEVPCCGGLSQIVEQSIHYSKRQDVAIEEHIISIDGTIKNLS